MKKLLLSPLLFLGIALSPVTKADVIGVWVGGGLWDWDVSGSVRYQSLDPNDTFDIKTGGANYLNWADDDSSTIFAVIEHPVPLIPNIKVFSTSLETSGTGQGTIDFGGITTTGAIYSSLEMDMSDITLYWDLLDNVVGLDIGINAKILDGKVTVVNIADSATEIADFSATIPMLYAGVDFSFPLTGLSAGVNGAYIGYDGSEFSEYHAYVRYDSSFVLGVEAGIKGFNIELDDIDQTYGKLEFSGPYAQLYLHF